MSCHVHAFWDPEASVGVATSTDIPGFVAEAPAFEELFDGVRALVPELLHLNGIRHGGFVRVQVSAQSRS